MIAMLLKRIARRSDGSALVEFALVAPLLITMVLGVIQAGLWMSAYNSVRSAANDTGRWTTVEYQNGNRRTNSEIAIEARRRATTAPYGLLGSGVTVYVSDSATQSISKVTEKSLRIVYQMPNVMGFASIGAIKIEHTRPLFVKESI
ncbi:TadE-like protein [Novosphingobium kunmingense]|uniref:TadE-like protein n=1 Tax=Novosphingobium kunmingense TaxID=1211806 RepID=A0A2N0I2V2_9SPHN|nr:TadE/TadG family type IV pilus assembly protein [Novosphingobium kunmingense]PKB25501.1 TadE-like protein [Novosphingobium kunmingense]